MGGRGCKTFENGIHLSSISYPLSFHILAHSFAKTTRGGGRGEAKLDSSLEHAQRQIWGHGLPIRSSTGPPFGSSPSSSQRKGAPQASPRLSQPTSTER